LTKSQTTRNHQSLAKNSNLLRAHPQVCKFNTDSTDNFFAMLINISSNSNTFHVLFPQDNLTSMIPGTLPQSKLSFVAHLHLAEPKLGQNQLLVVYFCSTMTSTLLGKLFLLVTHLFPQKLYINPNIRNMQQIIGPKDYLLLNHLLLS
jgi:hypothetical protein